MMIKLKLILICTWFFSFVFLARADSITGTANTIASTADAGSGCTNAATNDWTLTASSYSGDDASYGNYGGTFFDSAEKSEELQLSDFQLAIPAGSVINGISLSLDRHGTSGDIRDYVVSLSKAAGTQVGNNKADTATNWGTSDATINYGSASDKWGTTWTQGEVTGSGFGAVICVQVISGAANGTASIDYVGITVNYTPPTATNVISGTIYNDEGTTAASSGKTVLLRVGTSSPTIMSTTTTASSGYYGFNIEETGIVAGTPVSIWVDNNPSFRAFSFTVASTTSNDITGLNLFQNRMIVRNEGFDATSTTIADLSKYDGDNDADIQYKANSGALTVNAGNMLYIWPGTEFAPGGKVTIAGGISNNTNGSLKLPTGAGLSGGIATSSILTMGGNALTLAGSFLASSTSIFNSTGTTTMNATSTSGINVNILATSTAFYNLEISSVSATTTFAASSTVLNYFTATTSNSRIEFQPNATSTFQNIIIAGNAGNEIYLHSASIGNAWNINVPGTRNITYANIKDSDACGDGGNIDVSDGTSIDSGNNTCWSFPGVTLNQLNYGWAVNDGNLATGGLKTSVNTPITSVRSGEVLRLRMEIAVSTAILSANSESFTLQWKELGAGCGSGTWNDLGAVDSSESWRGYNNPSITNQSTLTNVLIEPDNIAESYEESGTSVVNPNTVGIGSGGEWDWVLQNNTATTSQNYCFRMVKTTNRTPINSYTNYPQLTTITSAASQGAASSNISSDTGAPPTENPSGGAIIQNGGTGSEIGSPPSETPQGGATEQGGGGGSTVFLPFNLYYQIVKTAINFFL